MKKTELIEFNNKENKLLRGILVRSGNSDKLVLMCGGFERSGTTEPKFKNFADLLAEHNISSFRFDYSSCGLSDGDFAKTTVKRMADELLLALEIIKKKNNFTSLTVVAHSLSACVVASLAEKKLFEKIILLAPALNQKELLRYWFIKSNIQGEITWTNYKQFLDEKQVKEYYEREERLTKSNVIGPDYFWENMDLDYSNVLVDFENILHIHGDKDNDVPVKSLLTVKFPNQLIVEGGNHDLEKVNMFEVWSKKAINFIE